MGRTRVSRKGSPFRTLAGILGIIVVGSTDEAERAIASTRAEEVLVTIPDAAPERLDAVVRAAEAAGVPCRIVRRHTEFSAPEPVEASLT